MRIALVEERGGQAEAERVFDQSTVRIGRDPARCHVVFDQARWPMVSRQHAELCVQDGRCLLVDTGSTGGTFVDRRRIAEPTELRVGSHVQLGSDGPVLRITGLGRPQTVPDQGQAQAAEPALQAGAARARATAPADLAQASSAAVELVEPASGRLRRFVLNEQVTSFGRDTGMDVELDASAAVVSRRHAEIRRQDEQCVLFDLGSFNGTLINGRRITTPTPLQDDDRIQLGRGGPLLRFCDPAHPASSGARVAGLLPGASLGRTAPPSPANGVAAVGEEMHTMVVHAGSGRLRPLSPAAQGTAPQLLMQLSFDTQPQFTVGRALDNDVRLDSLQISNHHARLSWSGESATIEDAGSTNGTHVNGARISRRTTLQPGDVAQIGPFVVQVHAPRGIAVFDTRARTRIDAVSITKIVPNRSGGGTGKLLDGVSLAIQPNEFVGLLGPSGAGKSTLMDSLNGVRPATEGCVLINSLDLYRHLQSIKQSIGYVPQDDIIHRELTVYRTLYYVARLRLSGDVSGAEIDQIVSEVMDVTGISERRDVPVAQLSGGQRKRVSIAVELITKPSVIFLDEPTSGLDPATEEKIMRLFRQIAESGRTVILTTHAMENVKLFDKIVVLLRGRLVFYGTPQEALAHVAADSFKDLYDRLEAPIEARIARLEPLPADASRAQKQAFRLRKEQIAEEVAEEWRLRFELTEPYRRNVVEPLRELEQAAQPASPPRRHTTAGGAVRQWLTLARRYLEVLARDRLNLLILFGQAPVVALLTYLVTGPEQPRDFPYFVMALVSVWFGTSVAAREIIRERAVYQRERMVNLGLGPYVGSKLFVLTLLVGTQCTLLFGTLKFLDLAGLMKVPATPAWLFGLPQLLVMILTGMVGVALGLFVSTVVKTSEMATSLVPLLLIPQILFSGLVGVPRGLARVVGLTMPATWSFDEMKRLSGLDTLRAEGSDRRGPNRGQGLYKRIEDENRRNVVRAEAELEKYRRDAAEATRSYERRMQAYLRAWPVDPAARPAAPKLGAPPRVEAVVRLPDDLSDYVEFKHPWMHVLVAPLVLSAMFGGLVLAALVALRVQDVE